ncbi:MAG: hypothetical protein ABIQ88_15215 [Chitinophagaceae bacterium]
MELKIILFLTLALYSAIASQSFSYIISLRDVQENMNAAAYIIFRKLTDKNFRSKFRFLLYAALAFNVLLVIICCSHSPGLLLGSAAISLAALVTDICIAVKGNMPINNIINTWTPDQYPDNWAGYRKSWMQFFCKRQAVNLIGFLSLLLGAIFS